MTNPDYTHWTLVVDRSGSMSAIKNDAQGGINQAFEDQRKLPGRLTVSLVQFDTEIDDVARMVPIADMGDFTLIPRGGTALLDAVGQAITITGEDLAALPEDERPANVIVQIVTDGQENSSNEWTLEKVREAIKEQQDTYGWVFAFIGAGDAAWQGRSMGTHSVTQTGVTGQSASAAYAASSQSLANTRAGAAYQMPDTVDVD